MRASSVVVLASVGLFGREFGDGELGSAAMTGTLHPSGELTLALGEELWDVQEFTSRQRSRVSDAHVSTDDLAGWFACDLWSRIGEAHEPSTSSVFGEVCSVASDAKLHPAACGNEDLIPLAVEPSNG